MAMIARFHEGGWRTTTWKMNSAQHGSNQPRRRAYTLTFDPEVASAADAAGVPMPAMPDVEPHVPCLEEALVPPDVVDGQHAYLGAEGVLPDGLPVLELEQLRLGAGEGLEVP